MKVSKIGVLGVGVIAALGIATPGFSGGNKYADASITADCGDGDTVNWVGPTKLWPPNHKFIAVSVNATDGDGTSNVTIEVDPVVTDVAGGDGGAEHDPDFIYADSPMAADAGTATVDFSLRAERSGKGEGRTYTVNWKASFDGGTKHCTSGDSGQAPFVVSVPHDMRDK